MNLFENKNGIETGESFVWKNEPDQWNFQDGVLAVEAPEASDYFIDEEGPSIRNSAPFLYTIIKGDFTLTTRAEVDMRSTFDSACLMIMADDNHWAKLCYENWMDEPSIVSVVTKEFSDDCASYKIGRCKPFLRMVRKKNGIKFYYSLDGEQWIIIRYFNLQLNEDEVKVGVAAQCPIGKGCRIRFEKLELDLMEV